VTLLSFVLFVLTGVLVGFLGGMFGFGGSSISTPILRVLFLVPPYFALASPLPMTLLSASIATKKYMKEGFVDWQLVRDMMIVVIPGSFLGAYLTRYIDGKLLMLLTAIFLVYVSVRFIASREENKRKRASLYLVLLLGFLIGLVSGMLANGGGILIVPLLVLLGEEIKRAIGTSMALVLIVAIPSILVHWYLGHIDWLLTLALSLGALPGAYLGSCITIRIEKENLRRLYGAFLLLFSLYFALFEIIG